MQMNIKNSSWNNLTTQFVFRINKQKTALQSPVYLDLSLKIKDNIKTIAKSDSIEDVPQSYILYEIFFANTGLENQRPGP